MNGAIGGGGCSYSYVTVPSLLLLYYYRIGHWSLLIDIGFLLADWSFLSDRDVRTIVDDDARNKRYGRVKYPVLSSLALFYSRA